MTPRPKVPNLFKPEHFTSESPDIIGLTHNFRIHLAIQAQSIFQAWIEKQDLILYNKQTGSWEEEGVRQSSVAYLIAPTLIQETECAHEPSKIETFINQVKVTGFSDRCSKCNSKLKATWTAEET